MPIELAKIQLNRVHKIETLEQASLVHHQVPGMEGNMTQDLGRDSVRLQIEGIFYGAKANDSLETLRKAHKQRQPVDFLADVVGQAYFSQVVLERFEVFQSAQIPDQFSYRLTITEYVPPKKSTAASKAAVNQAVKTQAKNLMNVATLPDALSLGSIPALTNPAEPLNGAVGEVAAALDGIQAPMNGLSALSAVQAEAPAATPEPPPTPAPLEWVKQPSPEELLKAGLPVKNLLSSGASIETLLQAGASVLELQQAGAAAAALLAAGASEQALQAATAALDVLSQLERSVWVTIAPDADPSNALALQPLEIRDASGTVLRTATFDRQGQAVLENLPTGSYTLVFTQLSEDAWDVILPKPPAPVIPPDPIRQPDAGGDRDPDAGQSTQWITLTVSPVEATAHQRFELKRADGTVVTTGELDAQGQAQFERLTPGTYTLVFPQLADSEWDAVMSGDAGQPSGTISDRWISLEIEPRAAIANQPFEVKQGDGTVVTSGVFDDQGRAQLHPLTPGTYSLVLLQLADSEWEVGIPDASGTIPIAVPSPAQPTWMALAIEPVEATAHQRFELKRTDGTIVTIGELDAQGQAQLERLTPGTYTLVLPQLSDSEWGLAIADDPDVRGTAPSPTPPGSVGITPDRPTSDRPTPARPIPDAGQPDGTIRDRWISLEIEPRAAIAHQPFEVKQGDGTVVTSGVFDDQGRAQLHPLTPGTYSLVLLQLADSEWEVGIPDASGTVPIAVPSPDQPTWMALAIEPVEATAHQRFELKQADGTIVTTGELDAQGQAQLERLTPGTYTLVLPQVEAADWQLDSSEPRWIAIAIETTELSTFAQQPFEIRDEHGAIVASGQFDQNGQAYITELEEGRYTLVFLQQIHNDWEAE